MSTSTFDPANCPAFVPRGLSYAAQSFQPSAASPLASQAYYPPQQQTAYPSNGGFSDYHAATQMTHQQSFHSGPQLNYKGSCEGSQESVVYGGFTAQQQASASFST